MQKERGGPGVGSRLGVSFCLLNFAFCISAFAPDRWSGWLCRSPGARCGLHVDAAPAQRRGLQAAPRRGAAARRDVQGRQRPPDAARAVLREQARDPGFRVLPVPDVVHPGDERLVQRPESHAVCGRQGLRRRAGQLRSTRHAGDCRREEASASGVLVDRARRCGVALADGRRSLDSPRDVGGGVHVSVG